MSGGKVAYHLRPNKHVERSLFVELLAPIVQSFGPSKFAYFSFGGPSLEDFRLIHGRLRIEQLVSLESEEDVWKRQKFNKRPACVKCKWLSSNDFIDDLYTHTRGYRRKRLIIWLDYAAANGRSRQFAELQTLIPKLREGDILKITLNANPATLGAQQAGEPWKDVEARRIQRINDELEDFLPQVVTRGSEITQSEIPKLLSKGIEFTGKGALSASTRLQLSLLSLFRYSDGPHQMLTATMVIASSQQPDQYEQILTVAGWEFLPRSWEDVTLINVPMLSIKERIYLEEKLHTANEERFHTKMPFWFDADEKASLDILRSYMTHFRRYPGYMSVPI